MPQHGALYPSLRPRILIIIATTLLLNIIIFTPLLAQAYTNPSDVRALQTLYSTLSNPTKLSGWQPSGGDPCGDRWEGIKCQDSDVVMMELSGLGLNGTMGYSLSDLSSLTKLDLSANSIHETIPYQLPPNLIDLNLAYNNITGNLPYSISLMASLNIINVSHNSLNQKIDDIFGNLASLSTLDISFNSLIGNLPNSVGALSNISTIYVQNNQLNGSLGVLADLPLTNLNVANNHFTGRVPVKLSSIPNFIVTMTRIQSSYDGNSLDNGPTPLSFLAPPSRGPKNGHSHPGPSTHLNADSAKTNKKMSIGSVVGIILACSFVVLGIVLVLLFCVRSKRRKANSAALVGSFALGSEKVNTEMQEQRVRSIANLEGVKPTTADGLMVERIQENAGSINKAWSPIIVTSYTVATLQIATNSFNQDFLIGEGSLGRVYKAEFPNGKTMAVKKMDNAALPLQEEEKFLEAVSSMSHLRHPNIVALAGYCAEHGQRLLVYEHIKNGNLHDMLHCFDKSRALPWNARVRIALGTARALEYLHEVCSPSIVHRNFKSANILLDEELNPHLSDCGVVAFRPNTERQLSTEMVGQFGYSAPEFAMSGIYTVKSDVYSFGVVMLELLTGRKPLDSSRARSEQSLVRWATPQLHDIDALAKMVDPALNGMYPAKSLSRFADIIALCVQPEPEFRPPMSEVVQALVRLVQRATMMSRRSSEDSGFAYRSLDHDAVDAAGL